MRHVSIFALLGLGVAGCIGGDDDFGIPAPGVDASVPGVDSSIPGKDTGTPDTTVPDTSVDSAPDTALPDTTPPPVTLTVLKKGAPESGVTIVFGDATGASLGTATTDATGTVSKELVAGSMITAIFTDGQSTYQFVTVVGVEPGDALTAIDTIAPNVPTSLSIDALPASPPQGTTQYYLAAGNCQNNGGQTPITLDVYPECQAGGKFPIRLQAYDDSNALLASSVTRGLSAPADGGLNEAGLASITLTGPWVAGSPTTSLRAFGFPAAEQSNHVVFSEIADGVPFTVFAAIDFTDPDAGSTNDFTVTPGLADHLQTEVALFDYQGDQKGSAIATRGAMPIDGGAANVDMGQLLPMLVAASVDSTDEVRPTVSWVGDNDAAISGADGALVSFTFQAEVGLSGSWTFVVPPTATSVRVPEIPGASAVLVPDAGIGFASVPIVAVIEASFIPNYAALRGVFASLPPTGYPNNSVMVPPLPVDGTVRVSAYSYNGD